MTDERQQKIEDFYFTDAAELAAELAQWLTDKSTDPALAKPVIYLEDGNCDPIRRAVLLQERLSDGSFVYNVRLCR